MLYIKFIKNPVSSQLTVECEKYDLVQFENQFNESVDKIKE